MSKTLLIALGIILTIPATAQTTEATIPAQPERNNEIGIFSNSVINTDATNTLMMTGLQYKRWVKPNTAYRTLVSYARYSTFDTRPSTRPAANDTVFTVFSNSTVNMAFLGAGVEMQRHFYKKVYLFAALELRGGTGRGEIEETEASQYRDAGSRQYMTADMRPLTTSNVNMTYVGFVPTIGAKLQFNRVAFGAEIAPLEMAYKSTTAYGNTNSTFDFNLGTFSNRFFFNFRF